MQYIQCSAVFLLHQTVSVSTKKNQHKNFAKGTTGRRKSYVMQTAQSKLKIGSVMVTIVMLSKLVFCDLPKAFSVQSFSMPLVSLLRS